MFNNHFKSNIYPIDIKNKREKYEMLNIYFKKNITKPLFFPQKQVTYKFELKKYRTNFHF